MINNNLKYKKNINRETFELMSIRIRIQYIVIKYLISFELLLFFNKNQTIYFIHYKINA